MNDYTVNEDELVFYSYFFGGVMLLIIAGFTGELTAGLNYGYERPVAYLYMLCVVSAAYVGIRFVLVLIRVYGSFVAMTITSCRKVVSIVLSFILFPKVVTMHFIVASSLVFFGIFLHIYTKNYKEMNKWIPVLQNYCPVTDKDLEGNSTTTELV